MYAELKRRFCTKCKKEKNENEFSADRTKKNGRNKTCKVCISNWRKEDKKKNPKKYSDYEFERGLKRFYGISLGQYQEMYDFQKGKCDCCGASEKLFKRKLHVDHDKNTKEIRSLLCTRCNPGLGYFNHSIERLQQAITYLKKFKK